MLLLRTSCKTEGYISSYNKALPSGGAFFYLNNYGDLLSTMFCKNRMSQEDRQKFKLKMYTRFEESLEVRLAGIKAAKAKLEEQIKREEINS